MTVHSMQHSGKYFDKKFKAVVVVELVVVLVIVVVVLFPVGTSFNFLLIFLELQ